MQPQLRTINLTNITKVPSKDNITQLVISSYLAISGTSVAGTHCFPKYALKNLTLCSVSLLDLLKSRRTLHLGVTSVPEKLKA